ncbi:MAG: SET domain-containing protein [Lactobacillaceae bacterium]|jgi:SET domain-containing protein|nr:SET domain-containing protein [Lactobacillaceae bacterium]
MILISYEVKNSAVHGTGIFTKERIKKGSLIAKASPMLDLNIPPSVFETLEKREKDEILYWGYYDKRSGNYHVDFDNTKFINHSKDGNVTWDPAHQDMHLIAKRDIDIGEELTQNYLEFESIEELQKRGISQ